MDTVNRKYSPWQLVVGEEGSYLRDFHIEEDFVPEEILPIFLESWYEDNAVPENTTEDGVAVHPGNWHMCSSSYIGSNVAWGASGFRTKNPGKEVFGIPNTDPNRVIPWPNPLPDGMCKSSVYETLNHLNLNMKQIYLWPDLTPTLAQLIHETLENPLSP